MWMDLKHSAICQVWCNSEVKNGGLAGTHASESMISGMLLAGKI
jgi:hypothetical protein